VSTLISRSGHDLLESHSGGSMRARHTSATAEIEDDALRGPGAVQQAAHDLRQPVAAVAMLASAALADTQTPEPVRWRLEQIVAEASWLSKIIHDMLAEQGARLRAEAIDIVSLVRDAVNSEQHTYTPQIILHQSDPGPRYVIAVSTRLRRALANVLENATRAAGPEGCVQLTERVCGNTESVEIVDDGPGFGAMAAGHRPGIGLQITERVLAECGGHMEVERLSSGHTMVRLSLPIMTHSGTAGGGMLDTA
jgi:signal transduction histidine kinase